MTLHFPLHEVVAAKPEAIETPEVVSTQSARFYRTYGKPCLDIALTILSLPLIIPTIAMLALLVSLDGSNPFYSQIRIGKKGRRFRIWKLRTMVKNADTLLEAYLQENPKARREWETTQKLKNDPRVTCIGQFLRKSSIDELPQLLNVLNGTMSLIGPRPMMVCQEDNYSGRGYYHFRPGITGLWQVSARNHSEFVGRVAFDETYDRTVSLKTDLVILLRTATVVLRGTGY